MMMIMIDYVMVWYVFMLYVNMVEDSGLVSLYDMYSLMAGFINPTSLSLSLSSSSYSQPHPPQNKPHLNKVARCL